MDSHGPTKFLDRTTTRSGRHTAVAYEAIDFMDAPEIPRAVAVGHDWGCRAGYVMAAARPNRLERLVAISAGHDAIRVTLRVFAD